jgi:hypothetical protein
VRQKRGARASKVEPVGTSGLAQNKTRKYTSLKRERLIKNLLSGKFKTVKAAMPDIRKVPQTIKPQKFSGILGFGLLCRRQWRRMGLIKID